MCCGIDGSRQGSRIWGRSLVQRSRLDAAGTLGAMVLVAVGAGDGGGSVGSNGVGVGATQADGRAEWHLINPAVRSRGGSVLESRRVEEVAASGAAAAHH